MNVEYELVRAYFEENGFWVRQQEALPQVSKKKSVFPFFEIFKTVNSVDEPPRSFRLFTGDLAKLSSAMFCLLGWQDSGFSNDLLTSDAKLIKFFRKHIESQKIIWSADDSSSLLMDRQFILIVPALPKSENKALELYDFFRSIGVNGVLTLSSVLENLLRNTQVNADSRGNSTFHLLRLLKAYGLATEPPLDIFG